MTISIYHNPRCSKSRATLALLQKHGLEPEIRLYLENPPDTEELRSILKLLGRTPRELMRTGEAEFHAQGLGNSALR